MNLLPYERIISKSSLSEAEALKRLSESVEPSSRNFTLFSRNYPDKAYQGKIDGYEFDIARVIRYRNSFLPRITGTIRSEYDGTVVDVKMKLDPMVLVFMCIWCGMVGFGGCMIFISTLGKGFQPAILIPAGMLLFACVMVVGGFKAESSTSRKDLKEIFKAEIIESTS